MEFSSSSSDRQVLNHSNSQVSGLLLSFLFPCDSFVQAIPGLLRADTGPQQSHWCFMPGVELCQNPLMWWNVVEIVVLDTAELELQLEVDVVIQIAPGPLCDIL